MRILMLTCIILLAGGCAGDFSWSSYSDSPSDGYTAGDKAILSASTKNADGKYIITWQGLTSGCGHFSNGLNSSSATIYGTTTAKVLWDTQKGIQQSMRCNFKIDLHGIGDSSKGDFTKEQIVSFVVQPFPGYNNIPPTITSMAVDKDKVNPGEIVNITSSAIDQDGDSKLIVYSYSALCGKDSINIGSDIAKTGIAFKVPLDITSSTCLLSLIAKDQVGSTTGWQMNIQIVH